MKYADVSPAKKLMVRRATAVASLESAEVLERMERAGWVRPALKMKQFALYSVAHLESAVQRLDREELPE